MKKILITGSNGFVGAHAVAFFAKQYPNDTILAAARQPKSYTESNVTALQLNMSDAQKVHECIEQHQPTHILHLAAQSSVGNSWQAPANTYVDNVSITLNLLEAMRKLQSKAKLLAVGSAEIYAQSTTLLKEESPVFCNNTYALSKQAQEQLCTMYITKYNLDIVLTRSFNHTGIGQSTRFVLPSILQQIKTQLVSGENKIELLVGNIDVVRDFCSVHDIVNAYNNLLMQPCKHILYNVCSGSGSSIRELIAQLAQSLNIEIATQVNPSLLRPTDNMYIVGDPSRIMIEHYWQASTSLTETMLAMLHT